MTDQKPTLEYATPLDDGGPSSGERTVGKVSLVFSLISTTLMVGLLWGLIHSDAAFFISVILAIAGFPTGILGRLMTEGKSKAALVGAVLSFATGMFYLYGLLSHAWQ
jgi:hypothetical protein